MNKTTTRHGKTQALADKKDNGKPVQWKNNKKKSLSTSDAYIINGKENDTIRRIGENMKTCGECLKFSACPVGHEKNLTGANFCRGRLCPMCQWRKSLKIYGEVVTLTHEHKQIHKSDRALFLTLTVPNVKGEELKQTINDLQASFKNFAMIARFKAVARSWFRGLEVTYNKKRNDYNPHFHLLLIVPKNYFEKSRGLYLENSDWLAMWQQATGNHAIQIVDIRAVRRGKSNIEAEMTKYATKQADYLKKLASGEYVADEKVIDCLHYALRNRRLHGYGGLFAKLKKELKAEDEELAAKENEQDGDKEPCKCSICHSDMQVQLFRWWGGNYYLQPANP